MKKIFFVAGIMLFAFAAQACAGPEGAQEKMAYDCMKAPVLKSDEAKELLKDAIPDVKILNVSPAPVIGLSEVMIQAGSNKGIVYIDCSKKYFISGAIIDIKDKRNLTKERFEEMNKVDTSKIPLDDALVMGSGNAKFRVIVFTDPDCPYCSKMHAEIKKVLQKRKDIVFFIKMLPLPMHPDAEWKSKSIICKKSLQMLEDNFAGKKIEKAECDTTAVEDNKKLASEFGINGTPAMVLSDGRVLPGYREADAVIKMITQK
jgi:thiol:disulfide interchange protein DsbC